MSVDLALDARPNKQAMNIDPLLGAFSIFLGSAVASSVPCHATVKFSAMAGGGKKRSGQGPPTLEPVVPLRHELKCFLDVTRRTVGQTAMMAPPANTCRRSHHPTRRQSNYEDAPPVNAVVQDHLLDHLPDREHLAVVALGVKREKPVKTTVGVVATLLLREQHRASMGVSQSRPT
jgi:hypothetical protein